MFLSCMCARQCSVKTLNKCSFHKIVLTFVILFSRFFTFAEDFNVLSLGELYLCKSIIDANYNIGVFVCYIFISLIRVGS